jgi:vancomycin permeability regulator SanA
MAELIVLLGAAVRRDGSPSRALQRRIAGAERLAARHPEALIFCSGGVGRHPPSEASIMVARLAAAGVPRSRLLVDEASLDTLQTCAAAARAARARGFSELAVCTCAFHSFRARMILRLLGMPARCAAVPAGIREMGLLSWVRMRLREVLAIPYDAVATLAQRRRLTA